MTTGVTPIHLEMIENVPPEWLPDGGFLLSNFEEETSAEDVVAKMNTYARAFLIAGVGIPIILHAIAPAAMPWWPDTVSMGIAFGATAIVLVWKDRKDRETRRRLWNALRAVGRRWTSN